MIARIQVLLSIALLLIVAVLLITSLGTRPLHGTLLMTHMFASGVFVLVLPLFAVASLRRMLHRRTGGVSVRAGYWLLLVTGFVTTATMFLSMLPIAGTDNLRNLISIHAYAGFAMVAAAILFAIGAICTCRSSPASNSPDTSP